MNIKRQLTLVEHTLTHTKKMKRKRKEREKVNQTVKKEKQQSSLGERIKRVDNPFRGEGQTPQTVCKTERRAPSPRNQSVNTDVLITQPRAAK